jgi:CubicO group peptidase (beta-lactamase class C family)
MSEIFDTLTSLARRACRENCDVYELSEITADGAQTAHIHNSNAQNDVYSVTKSFTAAAMGSLFEQKLAKPEDSVYSFFGARSDCGEVWRDVTIEDVLDQRVGIDHGFLDIDCDDVEHLPTDDYLSIILGTPLKYKPGTHFQYSDSNYYLASRIVTAAAGVECGELLEELIFRPLKFIGHAWARCPQGHMMGATGLFLRSADMAKFGMTLIDGTFEGKRILPQSWTESIREDRVTLGGGSVYSRGYWKSAGSRTVRCGGMLSQVIVSKPGWGALAWTACDRCDGTSEMMKAISAM